MTRCRSWICSLPLPVCKKSSKSFYFALRRGKSLLKFHKVTEYLKIGRSDIMIRIDKFLKLSMLVKRRTVAQEMTEIGAVRINKMQCKPATAVKENDIIEIAYARRIIEARVLCADEQQLRRRAAAYELVSERKADPEERPW